MPYFDGTGPQGKGPKSGRGQGRCNSTQGFNSKNNIPFGQRRNLQVTNLEEYKKYLESELQRVKDLQK